MQVYIVTKSYDDGKYPEDSQGYADRIMSVFLSREKAEEFIKSQPLPDGWSEVSEKERLSEREIENGYKLIMYDILEMDAI